MQLFKANADDIDVPGSRGDLPTTFFSQPGFDQRFGYGRGELNVQGATVTGGTTPLAQLDPRAIDTTHVADPDSSRGENDGPSPSACRRSRTTRTATSAARPAASCRSPTTRVPRSSMPTSCRGSPVPDIWSGKTGKMLPGSPVVLEDYTLVVNHVIAHVSGDDSPEAITGSGGYFLHAAEACGREAPGFPKFTNGWISAAAAVGDIDGDPGKLLELVPGTRASRAPARAR